MKSSSSIASLAAALVAAQGEMQGVKENAVNPFLKNKFANLDSIIDTIQPTLFKHGLAVMQFPTVAPDGVAVETVLIHSSGEYVADTLVLPLVDEEKGISTAQRIGKLITYARRYTLSSILRLAADEDTDGQVAKVPSAPKQEPAEWREELDNHPEAKEYVKLGPGVKVPSKQNGTAKRDRALLELDAERWGKLKATAVQREYVKDDVHADYALRQVVGNAGIEVINANTLSDSWKAIEAHYEAKSAKVAAQVAIAA